MKKLSAYKYINALSKAARFAKRIKYASMNTSVPESYEPASDPLNEVYWRIPSTVLDEKGNFYIPPQSSIPPQKNYNRFHHEAKRRFGNLVGDTGPLDHYIIKSPADLQRIGQVSQYYDSPMIFTDRNGQHGGVIYGGGGQGAPYLLYNDAAYPKEHPIYNGGEDSASLYAMQNYWGGRAWNAQQKAEKLKKYKPNLMTGVIPIQEDPAYKNMIDASQRAAMLSGNTTGKPDLARYSDAIYNDYIPSVQGFEKHVQQEWWDAMRTGSELPKYFQDRIKKYQNKPILPPKKNLFDTIKSKTQTQSHSQYFNPTEFLPKPKLQTSPVPEKASSKSRYNNQDEWPDWIL